MSSVTHIAMKDDIMILGDVTGALYLMNTSKKTMKRCSIWLNWKWQVVNTVCGFEPIFNVSIKRAITCQGREFLVYVYTCFEKLVIQLVWIGNRFTSIRVRNHAKILHFTCTAMLVLMYLYFTVHLSRTLGCGPFCFIPPARIIGSPYCTTRGWMCGCYPRIRTRSEDKKSLCTCLLYIIWAICKDSA